MPGIGWIKLHRKILDWEWYDDINTMRLWIHILLKVNSEPKIWHGIEIPAGTFITSYASLSDETGLTIDELRTAISKLERSKNITRRTTNKYQAITALQWEIYQSNPNETPSNSPDKSQSIPKPFPTTKEVKKIRSKEDKNISTGVIGGDYNFSPTLKAKAEEWLTYKAERHEGYKPIGLRSLLTEIQNNTKQHGEGAVIDLITQCMANGWKGIIFDKLKQPSYKKTGKLKESSFDSAEIERLLNKND